MKAEYSFHAAQTFIPPAYADFEKLKVVFKNYNDFMNEMMDKFWIGITSITPEQFQELTNSHKREA